MDYNSAMETVADLIRDRHLQEAQQLLRALLSEYPSDRRAKMILGKIDEATASQPETSRPMPADYHETVPSRRSFRAIKQAISQVCEVPWRSIPEDEPLAYLGLDSLDLVELAMELEDEFDIVIDDDTADEFLLDPETLTVRGIAEVISNL